MDYRLQMNDISKRFGEVQALRDVDFTVGSNEVVGLVGDNGAGKSTLIKIITGYHAPDSGEMYFNGEKTEGLTVARARQLGVETVYQERALADLQTLWRNIFMGREISGRFGFLDVDKMMHETEELMVGSMGFTSSAVAPDSVVRTFSGGEKQGVSIVRALHFQADLIILDEPTMGLALSEVRKLLEFVQGIKEAGKSCIFIDHNIFHVHSVADRIVVLDRGEVAGEFVTADIPLEELMDKMYRVAQTGSLD
ncbi:MAG: Fructose import ATP-binding protein FrcA [Anaerolineales bacterium]|nr:Fructose import ATP-binding protein FrcA [Anaerolineales bacterium]